MIPYSALSMVAGSIYFVTINKARKLPDFRAIIRRIRKLAVLLFASFSIGLTVIAILFENILTMIILIIGLPSEVYWPAVILVAFATPNYVILLSILSYFSGRGVIKQISIAVILSMVPVIPLLALFTFWFSTGGLALSIAVANLATVIAIMIYGYTRGETEEVQEENNRTPMEDHI